MYTHVWIFIFPYFITGIRTSVFITDFRMKYGKSVLLGSSVRVKDSKLSILQNMMKGNPVIHHGFIGTRTFKSNPRYCYVCLLCTCTLRFLFLSLLNYGKRVVGIKESIEYNISIFQSTPCHKYRNIIFLK